MIRPSLITTMRCDMRSTSGQLRRDHDDRLALGRELVEQAVDLLLGADVDAARGLVEDQDVAVLDEPLGDDDLLLVAAGEVLARAGRSTAS